MSNETDSFIDEVTEEVRRDRLYKLFRRYAWLGLLVILAIVGGATWREYAASKERARAQSFGDAILAAQSAEDPAAALAAIDPEGDTRRAAVLAMLRAQHDPEQGVALLQEAATGLGSDDPALRDLARLKLILAQGDDMEAAARDAALSELSQPGAPFRLVALELKAMALIEAGRNEDAVTLIRETLRQDGVSAGLRERLSSMLVVLDAPPEGPASTLASEAVSGMDGN